MQTKMTIPIAPAHGSQRELEILPFKLALDTWFGYPEML